MNEMQIFQHPDFGQVRTVQVNGEPWLVGKDVAAVLRYSNPRDALSKHKGQQYFINKFLV